MRKTLLSSYSLGLITLGLITNGINSKSANAAVIINVYEDGSDVIFDYSGSIELDDNFRGGISGFNDRSAMRSSDRITSAFLTFGSDTFSTFNRSRAYNNFIVDGPSGYGTSSNFIFTFNTTGDYLSLNFNNGQLRVSDNYISNDMLSGTTIYNNRSLTSLGLTDGNSFLWTLGSGDTITLNINRPSDVVPEPLTILGTGAAIAFGTGFKRKLAKANKK